MKQMNSAVVVRLGEEHHSLDSSLKPSITFPQVSGTLKSLKLQIIRIPTHGDWIDIVSVKEDFQDNIRIHVGSGDKVLFWLDL